MMDLVHFGMKIDIGPIYPAMAYRSYRVKK